MATAEQELLSMITLGLSNAGIPLSLEQLNWLSANEDRIAPALRTGDNPMERRIPYTLNRTGQPGFITGMSTTLTDEGPPLVYKVSAIWRRADGVGLPVHISDVEADLSVI